MPSWFMPACCRGALSCGASAVALAALRLSVVTAALSSPGSHACTYGGEHAVGCHVTIIIPPLSRYPCNAVCAGTVCMHACTCYRGLRTCCWGSGTTAVIYLQE